MDEVFLWGMTLSDGVALRKCSLDGDVVAIADFIRTHPNLQTQIINRFISCPECDRGLLESTALCEALGGNLAAGLA